MGHCLQGNTAGAEEASQHNSFTAENGGADATGPTVRSISGKAMGTEAGGRMEL